MSPAAVYRYDVYGITLLSEFRLTLSNGSEKGSEGVIVELRAAQPNTFRSLTGKPPPDPSDWFQQAVLQDGALYMRWKDWFELLVSPDGRSVLCGNLSNVALESFEAYLTNFAVSAALLQQGEEPLHATVVEVGDRAVGLVGPSGAGKSTLAAHLISRGGALVTDDMLRVTFDDNIAFAHPGPYRLKLFKEAAERYLQSAVCCGPFNPLNINSLNEKLIFQPGDRTSASCARRLSALFRLDRAFDDSEPRSVLVRLLTGLDLFTTIASSTMNSRLHSQARLQRQFRFAERLARMVPVYRVTYRNHYDVLNNVADRIYQVAPQ
jgi:hypothetical protein